MIFAEEKSVPTCIRKNKSRNCDKEKLEIYTLSTYCDVMNYVVREPEIRHVVVRESRIQESNILHGTEIGGKECSDDSD